MENRTKDCEKYIQQIRKLLKSCCTKKEIDDIQQFTRNAMDDFFRDNPEATFQDFEANYGSVEDFIDSVVDEEKKLEMSHKANSFRALKIIFPVVIICVIIGFTIFFRMDKDSDIKTEIIKTTVYEDKSNGK